MLRLAPAVFALALLAAASGCGTPPTTTTDAGPGPGPAKETDCANGKDDDGDGMSDCDDSDCATDPVCKRKPCSRQNPDCGDVVQETTCCQEPPNPSIAGVCLDKKCVAPGSHDPTKGFARTVSIALDFTFDSAFALGTKPESVVVRLLLSQKLDGTKLTCADVKALSGATEATRNQLDVNADLNQVFRNLWPMAWGNVTGGGQIVFPNNTGFHIARGKPYILFGEAWYGPRDLQNPTRNRAAVDCKEGIDLEAAAEDPATHFGLTFRP